MHQVLNETFLHCNSFNILLFYHFNNSFVLLTHLNYGTDYPRFTFKDINDDKVIILINLKIIEMNADNLTLTRENYTNLKTLFILKNIDIPGMKKASKCLLSASLRLLFWRHHPDS